MILVVSRTVPAPAEVTVPKADQAMNRAMLALTFIGTVAGIVSAIR